MSAPAPRPKPDECPCCGRSYQFRVPASQDEQLRLTTHYRCGRAGAYVYVHQIQLYWPGMSGGEPA